MSNYSDWRSDLREVMDDDVDTKEVKEKKVNNAKLIKINPKLGEAVEQLGGQIVEVAEVDTVDGEEDVEAEKKAKTDEKTKKKEAQLKKRIVRMKMMAVNQGAGDSIVAGYEPEGELVETSAVLDANKELAGKPKPKRSLGKKVRRAVLLNMIKRGKTKQEIKAVMHGEEVEVNEGIKGEDNEMRRADAADRRAGKKTRLSPSEGKKNVANMLYKIKNSPSYKKEEVELDEAERDLGDRLHRKRKLYDKTTKKAMKFARDEGEASGHARYRMGSISREMDGIRAKMKKQEGK